MFAIQSRNEEKFLSKQSSVGGGKKILKWNKKTFFSLININYFKLHNNLRSFEKIEKSGSFSFAANFPLEFIMKVFRIYFLGLLKCSIRRSPFASFSVSFLNFTSFWTFKKLMLCWNSLGLEKSFVDSLCNWLWEKGEAVNSVVS